MLGRFFACLFAVVRRIAFILYLVPEDWSAKDGGCLDLFATNENGEPTKVSV